MRKNIGKILLITLPLIVAAILLYPTYQVEDLEGKEQAALAEAQKFAQSGVETARADSVARMDEFYKKYGEELQSAKNGALKKGLDLEGGMYVTLEVDVLKLIEESALNETIDETFREVIAVTQKEIENSEEPVLELFIKNFNEIAKPQGKSLISYFDVIDFKDASEEKIIEKLEENSVNAIDQALEVIRQRVDKYGVSEPNIQKQGARRILLELPGVTNDVEMRNLLQTTARLEFKLLRNNKTLVETFYKIDQLLAAQQKRKKGTDTVELPSVEPTPEETATAVPEEVETTADTVEQAKDIAKAESKAESDTTNTEADTTATKKDTNAVDEPYADLSEDEKREAYLADHPFTTLFLTYFMPPNGQVQEVGYAVNQFPEGEYMFRIPRSTLNRFNEILDRPEVKGLIPFNIEIAVSAKPEEELQGKSEQEILRIYGLKAEPELTGDVITNAMPNVDQNNRWVVDMSMNSEGAERWAVITGANVGKKIAVVLDGMVYTAPNVSEKITGGRSQISGMQDAKEASLLEIVLKAGALKAPVQIMEERVIGPSLGEDSINSGFMASGIAFLLVIIYMIQYYGRGGIVADFVVMLNVTLILAVLAALKGTLTLPGIAGIILTIGMAVDANVLIFERIREELAHGRSLRSAVDEGFKKALSAILDSNITTFITGIILYYFGSGPIQGFALTLMIGILGTLFTGIMITRAIIEISIANGATHYSFGQPKTIEAN